MKEYLPKIVRRKRRFGSQIGMLRQILIVFAWVMVIGPVQAASFDCVKARSKIEKLICHNPTISVLDDALSDAYRSVLHKASDLQRPYLRNEQKTWLQSTRNACSDEICIQHVYFSRLQVLSAVSAILAKGAENSAVIDVSQFKATQLSNAKSSLAEIQELMNWQNQQLKKFRENAQDVLFDSEPEAKSKSADCKHFWNALKAQDKFDLQLPDMVVVDSVSKDSLFEVFHAAGRNNYSRFISQDGLLTPDRFQIGGKSWQLGPSSSIGGDQYLQELKQRFIADWGREDFLESDENNLFGRETPMHVLYMQSYPAIGYVHPLLVTVVKDRCDKCKGVSMGIRIVSVDGLLHPDLFSSRLYVSQGAYAEARETAERKRALQPVGPFLLIGMGMFDKQLTFWSLEKQACVEPSAKEVDEIIGVNNPIPPCMTYRIMVKPLFNNPGYRGPQVSCSVEFN